MRCAMVEAEGEMTSIAVEGKEVETMTAVERTVTAELVKLSHGVEERAVVVAL